MTGSYRFQTGLYGLTDKPSDNQKAMDYTLIRLKITYCFLGDILIVSKGSVEEHKKWVFDCLHRPKEENLSIKVPKCLLVIISKSLAWLPHFTTKNFANRK